MEKNRLYKQIEKLISQVDEDKESMLILGFDWETRQLAMSASGTEIHLAAMVASALEEDTNKNPAARALLCGFAVANTVTEGRILRLVKEIEDNPNKQKK